MDGVVPAGEGLLRSGGGVWPHVRARLDLCVGGGDGPNPGHGCLVSAMPCAPRPPLWGLIPGYGDTYSFLC